MTFEQGKTQGNKREDSGFSPGKNGGKDGGKTPSDLRLSSNLIAAL